MLEKIKKELEAKLKNFDAEKQVEMIERQTLINTKITELITLLVEQAKDGFNVSPSVKTLTNMLNRSYINPLTGEDDEWMEISDGVYQNLKCSRIFKDKNLFDGKPYYTEGKAFSIDGGKSFFQNMDSRVPVEFPLYELPETEYIILEDVS